MFTPGDFYVVNLGSIGPDIFFLFLNQNLDCGYIYFLKPPRRSGYNMYIQHQYLNQYLNCQHKQSNMKSKIKFNMEAMSRKLVHAIYRVFFLFIFFFQKKKFENFIGKF